MKSLTMTLAHSCKNCTFDVGQFTPNHVLFDLRFQGGQSHSSSPLFSLHRGERGHLHRYPKHLDGQVTITQNFGRLEEYGLVFCRARQKGRIASAAHRVDNHPSLLFACVAPPTIPQIRRGRTHLSDEMVFVLKTAVSPDCLGDFALCSGPAKFTKVSICYASPVADNFSGVWLLH